jgi:tetratricopeptide (TPR) repeat protein
VVISRCRPSLLRDKPRSARCVAVAFGLVRSVGGVYLITRRFESSLAEFKLALSLNPNFLQAQNYYATALTFCGRWQEGDEAARRALRLSPRDPFSALFYGSASLAQFVGHNYDEAIRLARIAIRLRDD